MLERHHDDETLISILEATRTGDDAHLSSCHDCTARLESFRMLTTLLHDGEAWGDEKDASRPAATIAALRGFAAQIREEEQRAEQIVPLLVAYDSGQWLTLLAGHPEWRTAGAVRMLINATSRIIDTRPPDAVALTAVCTEIADHLPELAYPGDTVRRLRGAAWRERAYALYYTGRFADANAAVDHAEAELAHCVVSDYDNARVGIVDALVLRALEEFDEATRTASTSAETFEAFGDVDRLASARMAEAQMMMSRHDFAAARDLLVPVEQQLRATDYADTHARVLANLGYCAKELQQFEEAARWYDLATVIVETLGIETEATRLRWNSAVMLSDAGRHDEALVRLEEVSREFEKHGMACEAALSGLDMAELLLVRGNRYDEVERVCRRALIAFEHAGLAYSGRAMTALAFMREAAQQRTASQSLVRSVREYLTRLPSEPTLLFAPPA